MDRIHESDENWLSDLQIRRLFEEFGGRSGKKAKIGYIRLLKLRWFCGFKGLLSSTCFELDWLLKLGVRALTFDETALPFRHR